MLYFERNKLNAYLKLFKIEFYKNVFIFKTNMFGFRLGLLKFHNLFHLAQKSKKILFYLFFYLL